MVMLEGWPGVVMFVAACALMAFQWWCASKDDR